MLQCAASVSWEDSITRGHSGDIDDMLVPVMNCQDKGTLWMISDS